MKSKAVKSKAAKSKTDIKAVVFDYGGVIAFFQDNKSMEDMAKLAGIDPVLMKRIYWENRSSYDRGLVNGCEFFKNILSGIGIFPDSDLLQLLVSCDIKSWSHVNPKTEELILELKNSGIKLAVLSNLIKEFLEQVIETLPVFKHFDVLVFSCEVNVVKPEEEIYRILLSQLGCKADEVLFFDDLEANVKAANDLGIQAFLWNNAEEARKKLEELCLL